MDDSKVAKVCKVTSIIIFVIAFIGTIIICNEEISGRYSGVSYSYNEFNWALAFTYWICSFIFCLFIYAVGEIILQLNRASDFSGVIKQQTHHHRAALYPVKQDRGSYLQKRQRKLPRRQSNGNQIRFPGNMNTAPAARRRLRPQK